MSTLVYICKNLPKLEPTVTGSPDLTCPSQLGSESSANGVTEGGVEEGGAGRKRGCEESMKDQIRSV